MVSLGQETSGGSDSTWIYYNRNLGSQENDIKIVIERVDGGTSSSMANTNHHHRLYME